MIIHIKPESDTPIYVQLVYQIKIGILKKELIPGEMLPSVRSLAGDIGVNMHTVNKAYLQLVDEKILTNHKKGFQVREREQMDMSDTYQEEFKLKLTELMIDAAIYQLSEKEVNVIRESINTEIQRREEK
ncbi:GntR family transcriptional regulator [Carnobacterium sp.]|uniref:GntR family transcriptional regulator n=1 Tax=Carnobacterium sp. TaxID=48221 RepID=UPI0028AC127D|nr:GntR family transcriptional regulator [Carnobacterium sp.]